MAESVARHEEDAKFSLQREHLLNEVVSVDAWVPIFVGQQLKSGRREKQVCQQ
jgi:hypothetical protein